MTPSIRPARVDELPATARLRFELVAENDGENLDERLPGWRDRHVAFYAERLRSGRAAIFVADGESGIVAMAAVYELDNHRSAIFRQQSAIVSNVYVAPRLRRRGIGAALTRRAIEWAQSRGCVVVRLRTTHSGRPLYESLGFRSTDELELPLR